MISPQRQNNFDLIRLLAAAQVVIAHGIGHTELVKSLSPMGKYLFDAFLLLPGVPVFFVISGFLITQSYERNPADLKSYFWRRSLRIFPALWVCLIVTLMALGWFGFLERDFVLSKIFAAWITGQVTFFQFYNPEHFRNFGLGVANGALWTITVELQFYGFVPLYHFLAGGLKNRPQAVTFLTTVMFLISFAAYGWMNHMVNGPGGFTGAPLTFKLLHMTLIPHLWMFMLGVHIHRNFEKLRPWLQGKFLWYLSAYALFMALQQMTLSEHTLPFYLAYLPSRTLLAMGTISAAFSARTLSTRLLHGMDLSYGTYLFHSVVINVFVQLGIMTSLTAVVQVFAISIFIAFLSWHIIEKPALACKAFSPGRLWTRITKRA